MSGMRRRMSEHWNFSKRFVLWLTIFALMLFTGCGVVTTGGESQSEAINQALAAAASLAAENSVSESVVSSESLDSPESVYSPESVVSSEPVDSPESIEFLPEPVVSAEPVVQPESDKPAEDGSYTSRDDVALYLETYGRLPDNFITKSEARALGWQGGSLEPYAPGKCIGGDKFGNYEGLLPKEDGRTYKECDIDTLGADSRGAKRIVYSNDGLIYYTEDHYASFTLLYD